ncbi:MAG: hypothetical protein WKF37_14150 [Bryobacteraceae bacterium]
MSLLDTQDVLGDVVSRTFLLANLASSLMMTGLVWFIQIVHYPIFAKPQWARICALPQDLLSSRRGG